MLIEGKAPTQTRSNWRYGGSESHWVALILTLTKRKMDEMRNEDDHTQYIDTSRK